MIVENLFTKKEAAKYLRVSTKTINDYKKNGKLIEYFIGRKFFFRESELLNVLQTDKSIAVKKI